MTIPDKKQFFLTRFNHQLLSRKISCISNLSTKRCQLSLQSTPFEVWELEVNRLKNMMMVMIVIMNYFCGMVDQRKAFGLISSRDHCQRSSPSPISNMPQAGFEPAQNLSSGFVEWSCAVVIITTPRCHILDLIQFIVDFPHKCFCWYIYPAN